MAMFRRSSRRWGIGSFGHRIEDSLRWGPDNGNPSSYPEQKRPVKGREAESSARIDRVPLLAEGLLSVTMASRHCLPERFSIREPRKQHKNRRQESPPTDSNSRTRSVIYREASIKARRASCPLGHSPTRKSHKLMDNPSFWGPWRIVLAETIKVAIRFV